MGPGVVSFRYLIPQAHPGRAWLRSMGAFGPGKQEEGRDLHGHDSFFSHPLALLVLVAVHLFSELAFEKGWRPR
jgi:hypothetical protein